jgi:transposase
MPRLDNGASMANNALWLDDWTVTALIRGDKGTEAIATYDIESRDCPKCGSVDRLYRHGVLDVKYRDIPTFGKPLVIKAKVARYKCLECQQTSMQRLSGMDTRRRMTARLIEYIVEQGIEQNYSAVAKHVAIDHKTVWNICEEQVRLTLERNLSEPVIILGIDELTIRRQKRTVFVDVANRKLLDIIDTMAKTSVAHWISWMPHRDRVRVVTADLWGPYAEVVYELLPNAVVVADKWHVLSKANVALDLVRSRFRKGAKGRMRRNPHRGRRLMHTSPKKLTPFRLMTLQGLLDNNPLLKDGWETKEGFYRIWQAKTREEAEGLFDDWAASIPESVRLEFDKLAATVENKRTEVFNYFDYPFTNAYTESRNRLMKDLNRAGRGYDFPRLRAKALLHKPITSRPLILCENCLGVFPNTMFMEVHRRQPEGGANRGLEMHLCANCHRRIHMEERLRHEVSSTPESR